MPEAEFYKWIDKETLILEITVQPGAAHNEIVGLHGGRLKVRIKAIPENGKSNRELCQFLARTLEVSPSSLKIMKGLTSRQKTLQVHLPVQNDLQNLLIHAKPSSQGQLSF